MLGTRRYPRSQVVSRLDQRDASLVLNLPFWYQYSDMTGSTIYSYDRNRHTGTVTGTTWGLKGRTFDGNDDIITIPDANSLDLTTAITIEMWVNEIASKVQYGLLGKQNNYELAILSNLLNFYYSGTGAQIWNTTTWDFTTGLWTHLVLSYTFGTATVSAYANGSLIAGSWTTGSGAGTPTANTANVTLAWTANRSVYGNIIVGECRLYNRALSIGEVQRNYQATKWRYA